jgi:hypothetical protein
MPRQYWAAPLPPIHITSGTPLANSVTLTDISTAPQKQFPAMANEQGVEIELKAWGEFSTTTGPPSLLLGFYWGGVAGIALATTGAVVCTASLTGVPWIMTYHGIFRSIGAAGSIEGSGHIHFPTSLTAMSDFALPTTKALRTVAVDTTTAKNVTVGAQWSGTGTPSASDTVTCTNLSVRIWS